MDADKWSQGFLQDMGRVKGGMDQEMASSNTCTRGGAAAAAAKAKPPEQLNCPRCNSTNTKFCYYNNYSLTQPRYFCKTCRRYWTEGGSLRNVPVGGGSRKNKRSMISTSSTSSSSASASASPKLLPDLNPSAFPHLSSQNPKTGAHHHKGQDLNLGFSVMQQETHHGGLSQYLELPKVDNNDQQSYYSSCNNNTSSSSPLSAMELLRSGMVSRGLNSFVRAPAPAPDSTTLYSNGFSMQDYKPTLSFPIDGVGNRAGVQENGGRVFFPFGEMKPISSTNEVDDQNKEQSNPAAGYWNNGVLGGGSW